MNKTIDSSGSGTSKEYAASIPDPLDLYHYKLYDPKELQHLLCHVAEDALGDASRDAVEKIDEMFVAQHHLLDELISLAATRWIFIAGNVPRKDAKLTISRRKQMQLFVRQLTQHLLQTGFSITACPQVKPVGKVALNAAEAFVADHSKENSFGVVHADYEIGGLSPVDRILRTKPFGSSRTNSKWQEHLMEFRRSYLHRLRLTPSLP